MKTTLVLMVLTFIVATPRSPVMFGHVQAERERRQQAEQQVVQEQQRNGQLFQTNQTLHTTISLFSAGVVTALIIGAAVGSKARRDHRR